MKTINISNNYADYLVALERTYYEKVSYENLIAYAIKQGIDYHSLFEEYVACMQEYTINQQKLEQEMILPATDGRGGNWSVNFDKRIITIEEH